jgi:hypothetical protein
MYEPLSALDLITYYWFEERNKEYIAGLYGLGVAT